MKLEAGGRGVATAVHAQWAGPDNVDTVIHTYSVRAVIISNFLDLVLAGMQRCTTPGEFLALDLVATANDRQQPARGASCLAGWAAGHADCAACPSKALLDHSRCSLAAPFE